MPNTAQAWVRMTGPDGTPMGGILPLPLGDGLQKADWYWVTDENAIVRGVPILAGTAAGSVEAACNAVLAVQPQSAATTNPSLLLIAKILSGTTVVPAASSVTAATPIRPSGTVPLLRFWVQEDVNLCRFGTPDYTAGDTVSGYLERTATAGRYRVKFQNLNPTSARTVDWILFNLQ